MSACVCVCVRTRALEELAESMRNVFEMDLKSCGFSEPCESYVIIMCKTVLLGNPLLVNKHCNLYKLSLVSRFCEGGVGVGGGGEILQCRNEETAMV